MTTPLVDLPPSLQVVAWEDPVIDQLGFEPNHPYVEGCWLPLLGPTSTLLYRRLATFVTAEPLVEVDTTQLAADMGVSNRLGKNGPFMRSLHRLTRFEVARWNDDGTLAVRRKLPPLPEYKARRLTPSAYLFHAETTGRRSC